MSSEVVELGMGIQWQQQMVAKRRSRSSPSENQGLPTSRESRDVDTPRGEPAGTSDPGLPLT